MPQRIAITGAAGQLGRALAAAWARPDVEVNPLARPGFDITREEDLRKMIAWRPDVVINAAAWTNVDACAREPERAMQINGQAAGSVAEAASEVGALLVQISTNEVFDGLRERPYAEGDEPNPINPYGLSKLAGEQAVAAADARHLIVRTAWLYGIGDRNFPGKIRAVAEQKLADRLPLRVVADEWGNPTDVRWLSSAIVELVGMALATTAEYGIHHLAGVPATSRLGWARAILRGSPVLVEPMRLSEYPRVSRVPPRAVLDVSHAIALGIKPFEWRGSSPMDEIA